MWLSYTYLVVSLGRALPIQLHQTYLELARNHKSHLMSGCLCETLSMTFGGKIKIKMVTADISSSALVEYNDDDDAQWSKNGKMVHWKYVFEYLVAHTIIYQTFWMKIFAL